MCDGRYDTPEHRLFRDQETVFKDDFHQPTFPVSSSHFHCFHLIYICFICSFCIMIWTV